MGSELVSGSLPREGGGSAAASAFSYTEVFYHHLPYYISIGMTPNLYWDGDCRLTEIYRKADEITQRRKNQDFWLQGMYIYEALIDVAPVLHSFAKKGAKPMPYSSEPYPITAKQAEEREERQAKTRREQAKAKVAAWALKTNIQMAARAGEEVSGG